MIKAIEAVYANGILRLLVPIKGLKKNQKVTVIVRKAAVKNHPLRQLCGTLPAEDAKEMLKVIRKEFEKIDDNAW